MMLKCPSLAYAIINVTNNPEIWFIACFSGFKNEIVVSEQLQLFTWLKIAHLLPYLKL